MTEPEVNQLREEIALAEFERVVFTKRAELATGPQAKTIKHRANLWSSIVSRLKAILADAEKQ